MTAQTTDLHEAMIARGLRVFELRRIEPDEVAGRRRRTDGIEYAPCLSRLVVQGWKVLLLP
jgi:hypothetical protein